MLKLVYLWDWSKLSDKMSSELLNTWLDISERNKFRSESIIICVFDQKFYEDNMILKQSMNKLLFWRQAHSSCWINWQLKIATRSLSWSQYLMNYLQMLDVVVRGREWLNISQGVTSDSGVSTRAIRHTLQVTRVKWWQCFEGRRPVLLCQRKL